MTTTHRIWYIVKRPAEAFVPADLRSNAREAWEMWLRSRPHYHVPGDLFRSARQAMNMEGVRACTVVTHETGVLDHPGL